MSKLEKDGLIGLLGEEPYSNCEHYILGKMDKSLFDENFERATGVLELVHINVCELFNEMVRRGYYYFITFTMIILGMVVCTQ